MARPDSVVEVQGGRLVRGSTLCGEVSDVRGGAVGGVFVYPLPYVIGKDLHIHHTWVLSVLDDRITISVEGQSDLTSGTKIFTSPLFTVSSELVHLSVRSVYEWLRSITLQRKRLKDRTLPSVGLMQPFEEPFRFLLVLSLYKFHKLDL